MGANVGKKYRPMAAMPATRRLVEEPGRRDDDVQANIMRQCFESGELRLVEADADGPVRMVARLEQSERAIEVAAAVPQAVAACIEAHHWRQQHLRCELLARGGH